MTVNSTRDFIPPEPFEGQNYKPRYARPSASLREELLLSLFLFRVIDPTYRDPGLTGHWTLSSKGPPSTGDFCRLTHCNFCRAEVANRCDFIAILVHFISAKRQCTSQFREQKLCAYSKVKLLLKVTVFHELHLKPRR